MKLNIYVRLADLAMRYGDGDEAETFINRASVVSNDLQNNKNVYIPFKVSFFLLILIFNSISLLLITV